MTITRATLVVLLALLGGCAAYTERTSPCVCLWEPIGSNDPNQEITA